MRQSFWRGAAWLTIGALTSKLLGAVYRIFLPRLLGDTGVGLFQMAYPLYAVALALSVSGIPIALSKRTAELRTHGRSEEAETLSNWALAALGVFGLVLAGLMEISSGFLATSVFHEPRARGPIAALAPALFLVALQAGLRGYFQGQQEMRPTAVSQILEQLIRVIVMFPLALWLLPRGISAAASGATLGAPAGAVAGLIYLAWRQRPKPFRLTRPIPWLGLGRLGQIAAPMAMAALLFPLMLLVDSMVVPIQLMHAGFTTNAATAAYGRLSGEAMPLVNLTLILGAALAVSLVPAIAEALAYSRVPLAQERVLLAAHAVWLVGLPMTGGLFVLANPLCHFLYGETGAAPALQILALGSAFLALQQILGNSLQAAGFGWAPIKNLLVGAGLKFLLAWWLTPRFGIQGAAASTVLAAVVTAVLNWRYWCQRLGRPSRSPWREATVPLLGTLTMVVIVRAYVRQVEPTWVPTLLALLLGMAVYAGVILALGEGRFLRRILRER